MFFVDPQYSLNYCTDYNEEGDRLVKIVYSDTGNVNLVKSFYVVEL